MECSLAAINGAEERMLISVLLSASSNFSSGLLPERQPVFTNPVNPAEKPAIRQLRIGIAGTDFTDQLTS